MSSRGELLQRAVAAQENFRERAGRISRHRRAAQGGAAEKIRLGAAAQNRDVGATCRSPRLWWQGGGGIEKISSGTVGFAGGRMNYLAGGSKFAPTMRASTDVGPTT